MLTKIGGEGSFSVPGGQTGTGAQLFLGVRISSPAWPLRRNKSVTEP